MAVTVCCRFVTSVVSMMGTHAKMKIAAHYSPEHRVVVQQRLNLGFGRLPSLVFYATEPGLHHGRQTKSSVWTAFCDVIIYVSYTSTFAITARFLRVGYVLNVIVICFAKTREKNSRVRLSGFMLISSVNAYLLEYSTGIPSILSREVLCE